MTQIIIIIIIIITRVTVLIVIIKPSFMKIRRGLHIFTSFLKITSNPMGNKD